jgi:uncharacterized membrane protein
MKQIFRSLKIRAIILAISGLALLNLLPGVASSAFAFFQIFKPAISVTSPAEKSRLNLRRNFRSLRDRRIRPGLPELSSTAAREPSLTTPNTFTSIDFPGAAETYATKVNDFGDVVGIYAGNSGLYHGFKLSGGTFTSIDFPGAAETNAWDINSAGVIVGTYVINDRQHGFRLSGGNFTTIDFPGARDTNCTGINDTGDLTGFYTVGLSLVSHGFKMVGGSFTAIDFPGAVSTGAFDINNAGDIVGGYFTGDDLSHGFKLSGGNFTAINAPGAMETGAVGINNAGVIVGDYSTDGNSSNGFRLSGGSFTAINFPGASDTAAWGINNLGDIVGVYQLNSVIHGFRLLAGTPTPTPTPTATPTPTPTPGGTTMQFSAAVFNANESAALATLTVARTGNTSGASSVDYKTNDSFAFTECNVAQSQADQRCDYANAAGTLSFNAGETSKSFIVPLVDDFYVEGSEQVTLSLSNPTGGALGAPNTATLTIADNDTTQPAARLFFARLDSAQEVPASNSTANGFGAVLLNAAETQITANMTFSGLSSAQTGAHIHAAAPLGVNAPVLFNLGTGQIANATFAINAAQVAQLKAGMMYFNVHTQNFTGGEIRGQILPNPLESARFFVRQQYADFLAREPDAGGFDFWTGQIATTCGADLNCTRERRVAVSNAFFFELEFQQTGAYVYRLNRAAYGNNQPFPNPNPAGGNPILPAQVPSYGSFSADRARVVGGPQLAQSQLALAVNFTTRPEFVNRYPASLATGAQFVDATLATLLTLGVDLSSQRAALINQYDGAGGGNTGRGMVLFRVAQDGGGNPINNAAFINAEYNRSFVITQYYGYLRRDGDLPGLNFWFDIVNRFPLPTSQNAMVCAFITSAEYQQRFNSYFIRFNQECPATP